MKTRSHHLSFLSLISASFYFFGNHPLSIPVASPPIIYPSLVIYLLCPSIVIHLLCPSIVIHLLCPSIVIHLLCPSIVIHLLCPSIVIYLLCPSIVIYLLCPSIIIYLLWPSTVIYLLCTSIVIQYIFFVPQSFYLFLSINYSISSLSLNRYLSSLSLNNHYICLLCPSLVICKSIFYPSITLALLFPSIVLSFLHSSLIPSFFPLDRYFSSFSILVLPLLCTSLILYFFLTHWFVSLLTKLKLNSKMLTQMIRLTKTQKSHVAVPLSVKRNVFFHCSAFECYCFKLNLLKLVSLSCYRSMSLLKIYAIKLFLCVLLIAFKRYIHWYTYQCPPILYVSAPALMHSHCLQA